MTKLNNNKVIKKTRELSTEEAAAAAGGNYIASATTTSGTNNLQGASYAPVGSSASSDGSLGGKAPRGPIGGH